MRRKRSPRASEQCSIPEPRIPDHGPAPIALCGGLKFADALGTAWSAALTERAERVGVEDELVASCTNKILMAELRQCKANGLARHAHRLGELFVSNLEDGVALLLCRRGCGGKTNQRLN